MSGGHRKKCEQTNKGRVGEGQHTTKSLCWDVMGVERRGCAGAAV